MYKFTTDESTKIIEFFSKFSDDFTPINDIIKSKKPFNSEVASDVLVNKEVMILAIMDFVISVTLNTEGL